MIVSLSRPFSTFVSNTPERSADEDPEDPEDAEPALDTPCEDGAADDGVVELGAAADEEAAGAAEQADRAAREMQRKAAIIFFMSISPYIYPIFALSLLISAVFTRVITSVAA